MDCDTPQYSITSYNNRTTGVMDTAHMLLSPCSHAVFSYATLQRIHGCLHSLVHPRLQSEYLCLLDVKTYL